FHEGKGRGSERTPSLVIRKSKSGHPYFRCYGCKAYGSTADFVMWLKGMSFPEALAYLTGRPVPAGKAPTRPAERPEPAPRADHRPEPSGLWEAAALPLVEAAAAGLWTPEGANALRYLTGPNRCLTHETIRGARLGWIGHGVAGVPYLAPGVV